MKRAKDSAILGCGRWYDGSKEIVDYVMNDVPFIYKISTNGELIGKKAIVAKDSMLNNYATPGHLSDFVEMDNGSILAVGSYGFFDRRKLIVWMTADGCILGDCDDHYIVTNITEANTTSNITLYLNPVGGRLPFGCTPKGSQYKTISYL